MRVSSTRYAAIASAIALAALLALPTAALADTPKLAACDDLLVTIAPTSTSGDVTAAAVTAQALVADEPGWESVTWSVPDTTELRDVLVLHTDGATRSAGATRAGTADHVLALGFCGSTGDATADTEDAPEATVQVDPEPAPADAEPTEADDTPDEGSIENEQPADSDAKVETASQEPASEPVEAPAAEEDDEAAAWPTGRDAGPYFEAALALERPTPTPITAASLPTVTLASTPGDTAAAATSARSAGAAVETQGLGSALTWLLVGGLVGIGLLHGRKRPTSEVPA